MDLTVDTSDLQKLGDNAAAAAAMVPDELVTAMTRSVSLVERDAKTLVPVATGNLQRSITNEVTGGADGAVGTVGTNVSYARYVEDGTYKMRARPYLKPSLQKNLAAIGREFEQAVKRILAKLGGS